MVNITCSCGGCLGRSAWGAATLLGALALVSVVSVARAHSSWSHEMAQRRGVAKGARAALDPVLKGKTAHWYRSAMALDPHRVDPLFFAVAKKLGAPLVLTGSDSIECAMGWPKLAGLPRRAAASGMGEVNIVDTRPRATKRGRGRRQDLWKMVGGRGHEVGLSVEPFAAIAPYGGERDRYAGTLWVNYEGNRNIEALVGAGQTGAFLIERQPNLAVPFKHGLVAYVEPQGSAAVLFRTERDQENFQQKRLTLPDEKRFPSTWHLPRGADGGLAPLRAARCLLYNLAVYLRAEPGGWRFSPTAKSILRRWADDLGESGGPGWQEQFALNLWEHTINQGIPPDRLQRVLIEDFGFHRLEQAN